MPEPWLHPDILWSVMRLDWITLCLLLAAFPAEAWVRGGGEPSSSSASMTINVANAPGWQASHTYVASDRVLAGAGWNGSAYTWGQPLYLWGLTSGGGSNSGTSPTAFNSCPSPSNYGGGLNGTIPLPWSGATTVTDGALTWTCLTAIDYPTWTAAVEDDSPLVSGAGYHGWQTGTNYLYHQYVTSNGNAYWMSTSENNPSPPYYCTSGSIPPTGTGTVSDGNCSWTYEAVIPYSSEANVWRHQNYPIGTFGGPHSQMQMSQNTKIVVWYGGAASQVYQGGVNQEHNPLISWWHTDYTTQDSPNGPWCIGSQSTNLTSGCGISQTGSLGDNAIVATVTAAPGDSFQDNVSAAAGPLAPSPTVGVYFEGGTGGNQEALSTSDSQTEVNRIQLVSSAGGAISGHGSSTSTNGHLNNFNVYNDLLKGAGSYGAISCDGGCAFKNDVIAYTGSATGGFGINTAYITSSLQNVTFVGPGSGCATCTAVEQQDAHDFGGQGGMTGVVSIGFVNPFAASGSVTGSPTFAYNATDIASSYTNCGAGFTSPNDSSVYTCAAMQGVRSTCQGGSCFSIPTGANTTFVNATNDLRLASTFSALYGAAGSESGTPATDILGTPRPTSGRYDIGAAQYVP